MRFLFLTHFVRTFCLALFILSVLFVPTFALAEDEASDDPNCGVASAPAFSDMFGPGGQGLLRANVCRECIDTGLCQITDIIQVLINVITLILGISGSIFLLMFIWGGFTWFFSGGVPANFQKGLDTIRDAIIGLIIVLGAYTIVNASLSLVRTGELPTEDLGSTVDNLTPVDTIELNSGN